MTSGEPLKPSSPPGPGSASPPPLVSCVMVTADRGPLAARAVGCFARQSYSPKELVVVDDGREDLAPILDSLEPAAVRYLRLDPAPPRRSLGALRNIGLEEARGELIAQWDDDDWYHPDRLAEQVKALGGGGACVLGATLMHVADGEWRDHPFIGHLPGGVPGTILHRREGAPRYPDAPRDEDTEFLDHWARQRERRILKGCEHLFIRCFHGTNTWEQGHFLRRVRNGPAALLAWLWWAGLRRDPFRHPAFRLGEKARRGFQQYLEDSRDLGLVGPS